MNAEFMAIVPGRVKWPGSSFSFLIVVAVKDVTGETGE